MDTNANATNAYRAARERIDRQIGEINHLVRAHAEKQAAKPEHWTYVGDLTGVAGTLNQANESLGGTREETTETSQR